MQDSELWNTVLRLAGKTEIRTVVDVGAYLGKTASWFLDAFPHAEVHSFEPDPRTYEQLRGNLAKNPRAHPSPVALSREVGDAPFHLGAKGFTSSLYPRAEGRRRYFHRDFTMVDSTPVETDTLDNLFAGRTIDILKLDTQGAELDILVGASELLRQGAISILVTEFFFIPHYKDAPLLDAIWSHLRGLGYDIYDLFKGPHASNGQIRYGDAIFVSPAFRKAVLDAAPDEE